MYGVYLEVIFFPSKKILEFEGRSRPGVSAYQDCISKVLVYANQNKQTYKILMILKAQMSEKTKGLK